MEMCLQSVESTCGRVPRVIAIPLQVLAVTIGGLLKRFADELFNPPAFASHAPSNHDSKCDSALVIDASHSMGDPDWPPTRLEAAKEGAAAYCIRLAHEKPDERVAIIGYGDKGRVFADLTPARDIAALHDAIAQIDYLGGTNILEGLEKASQVLRNSQGASNVVLLSDGHNTGKCPLPVSRELKSKAVISCVGIGGSPEAVDEELMREIASEYPDGSKRYRWIGDKERLVRHFQELAGRISRS
jgi:hypothetical protein